MSAVSGCDSSVSESCVCVQGANLQGVKMLCTNAEGASLRGCNFEDPAGVKANLEGEAANHKPSIDKRTDTGCRGERDRYIYIFVCVCWVRGQPEGCGHGGKSDDGHQPESRHAEECQIEEL